MMLLAFHAGQAGYPATARQLLAPDGSVNLTV
jgi:hypothetical protein